MDKQNFDEIYLNLFLEETKEQIQNMEEKFLMFEQGNHEQDIVNEIFRLAHSIKGSAAVMEYETMAQLSHNIENLLDKIRDKKIIADNEVMDVLFECIDLLKNMHATIKLGNIPNIDISHILSKINAIIFSAEREKKSKCDNTNHDVDDDKTLDQEELELTEEEKILCEDVEFDLYTYKIRIMLDENSQMKCIKGFMLIRNLSSICNIIKCDPPDFEKLSDNEFDGIINVIATSKENYESVNKKIHTISEIKDIYIKKVREKGKKDQQIENKRIIKNKKSVENSTHLKKDSTIRIDTIKIDKLLNLVGEFIVDKETLNQLALELKEKYKHEPLINKFLNLIPHLSYIGSELQEAVMSTRMLSLDNVFNRFPRMVRDLSKRCGKSLEFTIEGKETEVDKEIIEELVDPLTHIIRNAIDHGLEYPQERRVSGKCETGTLKLSGRHEGNNVVIEIEDDGRGIDSSKIRKKLLDKGFCTEDKINFLTEKDIIKYIFEPGFSTTDEVNDISGRGVGLDVVKSNIGQLNGIIDIQTKVGKGTKFIIKLPLTLAIVKALLVKEEDYTFAIPVSSIIETLRIKGEEINNSIHKINEVEMFKWRDELIPLIRMNNYFQTNSMQEQNKLFIVVVGYSEKKVALVVERLLNEREIVIKSMSDFIGKNKLFGNVEGISGISILGDGGFAYILDLVHII